MQDKNANERSGKPDTTKQYEMSIQKKRAERKKRRHRTKHLISRKESGKTAERKYER
jgi:hypothetical protein